MTRVEAKPFDEQQHPGAPTAAVSRGRRPFAPVAVYFLAVLSVVLFIAGFLAGEDGFGGLVRNDLYLFHGPTMWAFHTKPFLSVLPDYSSATTPLFQFLESLNPLLGHDAAFRATNALFALGVCALFTYALGRRFASAPGGYAAALVIGSSILLSPYFRAESYWVSTDVFPVFLVILTAILLDPVQDNSAKTKSVASPWVLIPLLALVSWSCFYCRQTDLFLPFYVFLILLSRFRGYWWGIVLLFGILGMPAVYLVHLWKGLTPPSFRHHEGFSVYAIVPPLSMVLTYAIPFLLEMVVGEKTRFAKAAKGLRFKWLFVAAGWIAFIVTFHAFRFNQKNEGGGIASRLLAHEGMPGRYLFLTLAYFGFAIVLFLCRRASWKGRVLMVSFFLPAFVMTVFFQRYYDPLLVVLFFLLWEKDAVARFITVRVGVLLMAFNAALLVGALAYNGRNKPVFLPLSSHPRPWTEIVQ